MTDVSKDSAKGVAVETIPLADLSGLKLGMQQEIADYLVKKNSGGNPRYEAGNLLENPKHEEKLAAFLLEIHRLSREYPNLGRAQELLKFSLDSLKLFGYIRVPEAKTFTDLLIEGDKLISNMPRSSQGTLSYDLKHNMTTWIKGLESLMASDGKEKGRLESARHISDLMLQPLDALTFPEAIQLASNPQHRQSIEVLVDAYYPQLLQN